MDSPLWKRGVRGDFIKIFNSIGVLLFYLLLNQFLLSSRLKLNEVVSPAWKINVKPLLLHLVAVQVFVKENLVQQNLVVLAQVFLKSSDSSYEQVYSGRQFSPTHGSTGP